MGLTPAQLDRYWQDGFLVGIPVLSVDEVAAYRAELETVEAEMSKEGRWADPAYVPWERAEHPLRDWFGRLARLPALLDAVEAVLGPNLLVRNADVFIKEPGVEYGVDWHVDTAQRDGTEDGMLSSWLGLGIEPVGKLSGGVRFVPGGHRMDLPDPPKDKYNLRLSEAARAAVRERGVVQTHMGPGEASLHHAAMPHDSRYNWAGQRRIGFVLRFITPEVSAEMAESGIATLVRGRNTTSHFQLREHFPVSWNHQVPEAHLDNPQRVGPLTRARRWLRRRAAERRWK